MYLVPPIRFGKNKLSEKLENLKKKNTEFRTPEKQRTVQMINYARQKKISHLKAKSLNNNRSLVLPAIVPMSAEQFRKFLSLYKRK